METKAVLCRFRSKQGTVFMFWKNVPPRNSCSNNGSKKDVVKEESVSITQADGKRYEVEL